MPEQPLLELEAAVKQLPGVLGCVILVKPDGSSGEIQAFARGDADRDALQAAIVDRVASAGLSERLRVVHVFELDAQSVFGDRQSVLRAAELAEQEARARGPLSAEAEPADEKALGPQVEHWRPLEALDHRPLLQRVVLSASTHRSKAEVALGVSTTDVVGLASGEKTPHGLMVVAQAALSAVGQLVDGFGADLKGASLVNIAGSEAVLVLVRVGRDFDLLGSALLRGGPASEATVRATLDAVNRLLLRRD